MCSCYLTTFNTKKPALTGVHSLVGSGIVLVNVVTLTSQQIVFHESSCKSVKPFNLAALKVDNFACIIILAPFILPIKVGTVSIFTPFNFAVMLSSWNSRNKKQANIKGFTVLQKKLRGENPTHDTSVSAGNHRKNLNRLIQLIITY